MEVTQSIDSFTEFSNQLPHWTFAFASASGFYFMAGRISGKHLTKEAKESLSLWLWGDYKSTWAEHFCNSFDAFFGERHLSLQCFIRSAVVSLFSVLFLYFLFGEIFDFFGDDKRVVDDLTFLQTLAFGAMLNIFPDYLSLFETRWLLQLLNKVRSFWLQCAILILDAIFSASIIWLAINIFQIATGDTSLSAMKMLAVFSVYSVFFYSTFITSVWAWLYCISTWVMRFFSETPVKNMLAIEEKPAEQLGLICAILLFFMILALQALISSANSDKTGLLNEIACSISADTCADVARISKDENIVLKYLIRACEGGETQHCLRAALSYSKKDIEKTAFLLDKACNEKDLNSCNVLGILYQNGQGVTKNVHKSLELYRLVCDGGLLIGCNNLGTFYEKGLAVNKDFRKARIFYDQACDGNEMIGCSNLGFLYQYGKGVTKDEYKAHELYQKACDNEFYKGCIDLGHMYKEGEGGYKDTEMALELYHRACDNRYFDGCILLGTSYKYGNNVSKDISKARNFYQKACDGGDLRGCSNLGDMYKEGVFGVEDKHKAKEMYQRACELGGFFVCNQLGDWYKYGLDIVEKNTARAREFYQKACDLNHGGSCIELGTLYLEGRGGTKDVSKAQKLMKDVCDTKDYEFFFIKKPHVGCHYLGFLHEKGLGVVKDNNKAWINYLLGCVGGNSTSCIKLSVLRHKGIDMTYASQKAREEYQQRCNEGNILNCVALGYLYKKGLGVTKNIPRAQELYQQGCDVGIVPACNRLKNLNSSLSA